MHQTISYLRLCMNLTIPSADFNQANRQSYLPIVPFFIKGGKMMEMMDNNVA